MKSQYNIIFDGYTEYEAYRSTRFSELFRKTSVNLSDKKCLGNDKNKNSLTKMLKNADTAVNKF